MNVGDLSASTFERKDLAKNPCALVKVQLAAYGAQFEGNVVGDVAYKTGEYWVYMTEGSKELRIKHPNFVPLHVNFSDYSINGVTAKQTYTLTLVIPQTIGMDMDDGMRYLAMTVEPTNATVYIDNNLQTLENGTLSLLLPMGQHEYRVEAQAYETKTGTFTIGYETLQLPIKLESAMASLSINSTTQGTQIYVNDQMKGTSSWSGSLRPGTYRVEGRLQGYRNHRQNITLAQRDRQQLTIPALQAITGVLNVNYQPLNAEVWIDGKKVGTSPNVFRNIIIGNHNVELRAEGYTSKQERVNIEEGKTAMLSGALTQQQSSAVATSTTSSSASSSSSSAIETITVNGVSFNMVRVEGGTFLMGNNDTDAESDEKPVHQVTLSDYYIGETEVTQELWQAVMGSTIQQQFNKENTGKLIQGIGANHPIAYITWSECQEFVSKLNEKTGRKFRLPTEAEWEYAARGGNKSHGYKYSGSNNIDDVAWYTKTTNDKGTRDVKTKQPNELGLYDMSGNVSEWCQDLMGKYIKKSQTNPTGPANQDGKYNHVIRGGSWYCNTNPCKVSIRRSRMLYSRYDDLGLRLAL